jgi:hypothetical protein
MNPTDPFRKDAKSKKIARRGLSPPAFIANQSDRQSALAVAGSAAAPFLPIA